VKTVSEFLGIPKTVSGFSRSDLSVSVFFGNGIGCRNFDSESVSKSVRRFTDRFHRLPILVGILPDSAVGISENTKVQPTQPTPSRPSLAHERRPTAALLVPTQPTVAHASRSLLVPTQPTVGHN
jgi:hypothetical protein